MRNTSSLRADGSYWPGTGGTGATVTIQNAGLGGDTALVEPPGGTAGRYTASKTSLPAGDFTLSVVKGTDSVQGVVVGSPGLHAINSPVVSSTAPANQPLDVS